MQLGFGSRPNVTWWCGFGSAGVQPAVLHCNTSTRIAGGTPAPPNPVIDALLYLERLADKRNSFFPILMVPSKSLSTAVPRTVYFLSPSVTAPRKIAPLSEPPNVASPFLLFTVPVILAPSCVTLHCSVKIPSIVLWIVTIQLPTIFAIGVVAAPSELSAF